MKLCAPSNPSPWLLLVPLAACVFTHRLGEGNSDAGDATATTAVDDTGGAGISLGNAAQVMAEARCGAFFACGCGDGVAQAWSDVDACIEDVRALVEDEITDGIFDDLTFDPDCAQAFAGYFSVRGCVAADDVSEAELAAALTCGLFDGGIEVGGRCSRGYAGLPPVRACAPGLVCRDERCTLEGVSGTACDAATDCAAGLACDQAATPPVCAPWRTIGTSCNDDSQCEPGSFCDHDVCAAKAAPGEPCTDAFGCLHGVCDTSALAYVCEARIALCDPTEIVVEDGCDQARAALQSFIESNRACNDVGDCIERAALCHDETQCGSVAVAADADLAAFDAALALVEQQCQACGGDPCGSTLVCDAGSCGLAL